MLRKHLKRLLPLLRTEWMMYGWRLFWSEGIHVFVKFLEEQYDHVLFLQDLWWCYAVNRYNSLFFHLYWPSFLLLYLTIAILLLGYQMHTQRNFLIATACNWKHVLHIPNPFSRKASLSTSLEDRPHHQGWRKAFLFHFPQNLQALVR